MIGLMMLAAAFAPAEPIHPEVWLSSNDYPKSMTGDDTQTSQRIALLISPEGKPTACELLMVENVGRFNAPICQRLTKRGQFKPAMENGNPTWGIWTTTVNFLIPSNADLHFINYDIIAPVNKLPGKGIPQGVTINQLVDVHGKVEACIVPKGSAYDTLNRLACAVTNVLPMEHIVDGAGRPVRSVVKQTVLFVVDPAATKHP